VIERVYIDNFRCFSSFELRLDRVNLLIGPNGSGKSSLVAALAAIADSLGAGTAPKDDDSWFSPDDLTRWDTRDEQRFELDVRLDGARYGYLLRLRHDADAFDTTIVEETVERDGSPLFAYRDGHVHLFRDDGAPGLAFPFGAYHSFLPEVDARPEYASLTRFLR
jgi:predicted ATPase